MRKTITLFFAFALCCLPELRAQEEHHYGPNGVCTDDGCTNPYQPAEQAEDGYYLLANAGNVEWFSGQIEVKALTLPANARMTADIDFTGVAHNPIGHDNTNKYQGVFDGQGHRITNMKEFTIASPVALVGAARGSSAFVRNVIIDKSCEFTGLEYVASLVGDIEYPPSPSYTTIENCVNEANVTASNAWAGGFIGGARFGDGTAYIVNCVNRGNVSAMTSAGAFIGATANGAIVISSYNEGNVLEGQNGANNLVANGDVTFTNVFDVSTMTNRGQGVALSPEAITNGELAYKLNGDQNEITWTQTIGQDEAPVLGTGSKQVYAHGRVHCNGTTYENATYNNDPSGDVVQDEHNFVGGICTYCKKVVHDYLKPDANGVYHLSNVEQVEWFSAMVNTEMYGGMKAVLDDDIDFGGVENAHTPIGNDAHKFFGQFDGQGHHIHGMVINLENIGNNGAGFFGSLRGGGTDADGVVYDDTVIVRNLIIDNDCSVLVQSGHVAGVVGRVNARNSDANIVMIENCGNEADITSVQGTTIGGIVGCVQSTTVGLIIRNCYNTGSIAATAECAAIAGWTGTAADGLVKVFENCWNTGDVVGMDANRNLARTPDSGITLTNCYDLNENNRIAGGGQGLTEWTTDDPVSSGELAVTINGERKNPTWFQTLGSDTHPVTDHTHGYVYRLGEEYGDVHDESSFLNYRNSLVSYEQDQMNELIATQSLIDTYLSYSNQLLAAETLTELLNIYYDTMNETRALVRASAATYNSYMNAVAEVIKKLEENPDLAGDDKERLEQYLNSFDEPGEDFPHGAYSFIIEQHTLTAEDVTAEISFLNYLYEQALRNSLTPGSDLTSLIVNPTLADGTNGWTVTGNVTTGGIVEVMPTAQAWNTTFDLHQTIEGLHNGLYELVANGVFRSEPRDENTSYVAYMYAGDTRVYLPNIFEDYLPLNKAEDRVNCYITPGASTLDTEIYVDGELVGYAPQGLVGESYHFSDGRYVNRLLVEVTDGTLTIGMANPGTGNENDWTGFGNFRLIYRGTGEQALESAAATLEGMAARARTLCDYHGNITDFKAFPNYSTELREALEQAISQVDAAADIDSRMTLITRFSDLFKQVYECRMAYRSYMSETVYFQGRAGDLFIDNFIDDKQYDDMYTVADEIIFALDEGAYTTEQALAQEDLKTSAYYKMIFGEEPEQDADGWYLIKNGYNVEWFTRHVDLNDTFAKARLMNDIDMAGIFHTPIGMSEQRKFNGQFDGQFHRILNMTINNSLENQGFFGWVRGGGTVIKNIIIDKTCSVTAGNCAAGLIGKTQVYADAPLYVLNCVNEANVTSTGTATGILGAQTTPYAYIIMHNCVNAGNITTTQEDASDKYASAFIGWHGDIGIGQNSQLWNCLNIGQITPIEPNNYQLFRGTFRSWENDYDILYHDAPYQGVHNAWETEDPLASGEVCWLLNQGETQGISYKQTLGVDPYPLPVDDGKHLPVLKAEDGTYYNEGVGIVEPRAAELSERRSTSIYDLSGRRVERITRPGIYVQDGRKVMK